MTEDDKVSME